MDLAEIVIAFGPLLAVGGAALVWWASLGRQRRRPGPPDTTAAETALRDRADDLRVEAAGLEGQAKAIEERAAENRAEAVAEVDAATTASDVADLHNRRS